MAKEVHLDKTSSLTQAKRRVMGAAIAGWVLAFLTITQLVFPWFIMSPATIISFGLHSDVPGVSRGYFTVLGLSPFIFLNLVSFILVVGLTIGVNFKNRVCAILLCVYGVIALIVTLPTAIHFLGIPFLVVAVILGFMANGMVATFEHHSLKARDTEF